MRVSSAFRFDGIKDSGRYIVFIAAVLTSISINTIGQTSDVQKPRVVQPGAPGQPTRQLPSDTRARLLAVSPKDVDFMQGMIMHHAQAVEMTALIAARTANRDIQLLGERISKSQEDEIAFMMRWLEIRNQPTESKGHGSAKGGGHGGAGSNRMPGMLSAAQMNELRNAKGREFDRLFLEGMIQHHQGALVMVKDLFETAGAGQDAEIFNFATDVDSGQRAEIKTMETLLSKIP